ncbi:MAG: phosphoserine phosphatase SerB [Polyangiaceae bacterium]|nr:phosphoserine phosphatase SerB [Polyangiaceae bacterium]
MTDASRIVLHIAGVDRPGVTARLAEVVAAEQATIVTIGQSVLHGYLMLSAIVELPPRSNALREILFAVSELGLRLEVSAFRSPDSARGGRAPAGICVTLLGELGDGKAVAAIARAMAERRMSIREMRSLSEERLSGLELITDVPDSTITENGALARLRGDFLRLGTELGVDLAVQKDDIFRKTKRLVCMDVDSTFTRGELIDELAAEVGAGDRVQAITARAMRGELDFRQALAERVALLEGLPLERARAVASRIELTPGAERFVHTLKSLGFKVGLVSGGFDFFVDALKRRFALDFCFSNELEVVDGRLTGRVQGTIVDGERKAQIVRDMARVYELRLEQTVAVGDGANDMLMLQTAGLGIAFHGKPRLQAVSDVSLNHHDRLDTLLLLMGFGARDLAALR